MWYECERTLPANAMNRHNNKELTPEQCHACIDGTQRMCRNCGGGYCIIHNEGSNLLHVSLFSVPGYGESLITNT